jgi:catechol 2,3-dioxygenase-like lactoylglutathione lyase family enzyme
VKPVTIVMVTDMDRSLDWYRRLLPEAVLVASSGYWSELSFGEASLALHIAGAVEPGSQVALALTAEESLEGLAAELAERGIDVSRDIRDEAFGRSLAVTDPDGLSIQVNEHRPASGHRSTAEA